MTLTDPRNCRETGCGDASHAVNNLGRYLFDRMGVPPLNRIAMGGLMADSRLGLTAAYLVKAVLLCPEWGAAFLSLIEREGQPSSEEAAFLLDTRGRELLEALRYEYSAPLGSG